MRRVEGMVASTCTRTSAAPHRREPNEKPWPCTDAAATWCDTTSRTGGQVRMRCRGPCEPRRTARATAAADGINGDFGRSRHFGFWRAVVPVLHPFFTGSVPLSVCLSHPSQR